MRVRRTGFVLAMLLVAAPFRGPGGGPSAPRTSIWSATTGRRGIRPTPAAAEQVHIVVKGDTPVGHRRQVLRQSVPLAADLGEEQVHPGRALDLPRRPAGAGPRGGAGREPVAGRRRRRGRRTGDPGDGRRSSPPSRAPATSPTRSAGSPVPLGGETDIYCQGYVGDLEEPFPYSIVGSEYESLVARQLIRRRPAGWSTTAARRGRHTSSTASRRATSSTSTAAATAGSPPAPCSPPSIPEQPIIHPLTREVVGRYYRYLGRLRILSVQENTRDRRDLAVLRCDHRSARCSRRSSRSRCRSAAAPPCGRSTIPPRPRSSQGAPAIVYAKDDIIALGDDHVVHIDLGEQDATPGDMYTIYRAEPAPACRRSSSASSPSSPSTSTSRSRRSSSRATRSARRPARSEVTAQPDPQAPGAQAPVVSCFFRRLPRGTALGRSDPQWTFVPDRR